MILIFITLLVIASIILSACLFSKQNNRKDNIIGCSIVAAIVGIMFIIVPLTESYSNYLDIKADYYVW